MILLHYTTHNQTYIVLWFYVVKVVIDGKVVTLLQQTLNFVLLRKTYCLYVSLVTTEIVHCCLHIVSFLGTLVPLYHKTKQLCVPFYQDLHCAQCGLPLPKLDKVPTNTSVSCKMQQSYHCLIILHKVSHNQQNLYRVIIFRNTHEGRECLCKRLTHDIVCAGFCCNWLEVQLPILSSNFCVGGIPS